MVAEMTGGYGLIVPSMLTTALSFLVQRALGGRFRYSQLYESQIEARIDSPVHRERVVQGVFRALQRRSGPPLEGISLPDLDNLLEMGGAITIHNGRGRLFAVTVEQGGDLVGRTPAQLAAARGGMTLTAVVREDGFLLPRDVERFTVGDQLILVADEASYQRLAGAPDGRYDPDGD
jgi:hypothetical protein